MRLTHLKIRSNKTKVSLTNVMPLSGIDWPDISGKARADISGTTSIPSMCVGAPSSHPTMMATPPTLRGRLHKPAVVDDARDEVFQQIEFEQEAQRSLRRLRLREDRPGFRRLREGIVGPLDALGTKIAVRHGSRMGVVSTEAGYDCSGGWSRSWQAARSAAVAGTAGLEHFEPTPVTPVSEEELAYASSEQESDDNCDCDAEQHDQVDTLSEDMDVDDLIEQIQEMALWVSKPGAGRTIVVSSA
jgi:hypothetical protein